MFFGLIKLANLGDNMLFDGIKLVEGSEVQNLVVDSGTSFPGLSSEGELFYRTDGGNESLYVYNGTDWVKLINSEDSFTSLLPDVVTAGTYKSVTVNAKGTVTGGTNPTTLAGYSIADAYTKSESDTLFTNANTGVTAGSYGSGSAIPTFTVDLKGRLTAAGSVAISNTFDSLTAKPTTVAGYSITDAYTKTEVDSTFLAKTYVMSSVDTFNVLSAGVTANVTAGISLIHATVSGVQLAKVSSYKNAGKFAFEFAPSYWNGSNHTGMANAGFNGISFLGEGSIGSSFGTDDGGTLVGQGGVTANGAGPAATQDEVRMIAVDLSAGKAWIAKNNVWANSGNPATGANPSFTWSPGTLYLSPAVNPGQLGTGQDAKMNLGGAAFINTVPSGFTAGWGTVAQAGSVISVNGRSNNVTLISSDVTSALTYTPVNKAGDSMSGTLVISPGAKITLADTAVVGTDAVNKNYVDSLVSGLSWKNSVKAASGTNITLSGIQTIDGISVVANDRVLVMGQTTTANNGIYVVSAGAWARSSDADTAVEIAGLGVWVQSGTIYGDTGWTCTSDSSLTLGSTAISFAQFNGASGVTAGVGLIKTGNTLSVGLGAGLAQLPTSEVGIDLYTNGNGSGLLLTTDGVNSSTSTAAKLMLPNINGLTAGLYGSSSQIPQLTIDTRGRVTLATYNNISLAFSSLTSKPTTIAGYGITDGVTYAQGDSLYIPKTLLVSTPDSFTGTHPSYTTVTIISGGRSQIAAVINSSVVAKVETYKNTGKYFFEGKQTGNIAGQNILGFSTSAKPFNAASVGIGDGGSIGVSLSSGNFTGNLASMSIMASSLGTIPLGTTVQVAIDLDAGKAWFGKGGVWSNGANPATGANPFVTWVPGAFAFAPCVQPGPLGNGSVTEVNLGTTAFDGIVPAGFAPGWGTATAVVPVANGGTGSTSPEYAMDALGGSFINPSSPKDGDIQILAGPIISIYATGSYRQIFPAVYS